MIVSFSLYKLVVFFSLVQTFYATVALTHASFSSATVNIVHGNGTANVTVVTLSKHSELASLLVLLLLLLLLVVVVVVRKHLCQQL